MNIIETNRQHAFLEVEVLDAFNLATKNVLESRLSDEIMDLKINLSKCRLVDSEAVIFMYRWQQSGKGLEIINPPEILFEICDILELKDHWELNVTQTKNEYYG